MKFVLIGSVISSECALEIMIKKNVDIAMVFSLDEECSNNVSTYRPIHKLAEKHDIPYTKFKKINDEEIEIDRLIVAQNGKVVEIPAIELSTTVRELIAEQNGIELPDENINAELEKAKEELSQLKNSQIKYNPSISDLISSVAYNSRVREREIDDWTVLEFENRRKAIERDKKYMIFGQAEMSGMVTFKKGNPYSSWCYDSIDESMGTMALSALAAQNGDANIK